MTNGEIFILFFVTIVFLTFIFIGIKLFKWNKKEREEINLRNQQRKTK